MTYDHTTATSVDMQSVPHTCDRSESLDAHSRQGDEMVAIAQQLLSETAHDLQSPLMAARESVRLVNDGYLGQITDEQRNALLGALSCCSDMEELIDNMLRLEGLRNGMPRVYRQWIDAATVAQSVSATITSAGLDDEVAVVWDGPSTGHHLLYSDPDKLRRLLLNLLRNAIRATPSGGQVMVRMRSLAARGTFHFSIIDRGHGMQPSTLRKVADRGSSSYGGAGLGLAISRQMASLHFGNLEISTQHESGTCVSFEVPSAGPSAVADSWCRWRELFRSSPKRSSRRGSHTSGAEAEMNDEGTERVADGSETTIVLTHEGPAPQHPDSLTALSLQLPESTSIDLASRLDERLQEGLRMYELAYRAAERRWVILWDADAAQAKDRIENTNRSIAAALPAANLSWSKAIQLPVGTSSTRASVRDLLVRDMLGARSEAPIGDDRRMSIGNEAVRSVTPDTVARRLDAELRRLTSHLGRQRNLMQQQAAAIRPPQ